MDPESVLATVGWGGRDFRRITSGWDNLTWRFATPDGRVHALRLARNGGEGRRHAAAAEAAAMEWGRAAGLPVPAIEARGEFEARPFFVVEWADGSDLATLVKQRPWNVTRVGRAMGRLHARLHAIAPPAGLRAWDATAIERAAEHEGLRAAVLARARFDTFCHLDFHPLNLLGRGARVTAILDWANAARSDRRIDLACTNATLLYAPLPPGEPRRAIQVARTLLAWGWRRGYRDEAGYFPLDTLSEAFGVARFVGEMERAVSEGRGWLTTAGLAPLQRLREAKLRAAGI